MATMTAAWSADSDVADTEQLCTVRFWLQNGVRRLARFVEASELVRNTVIPCGGVFLFIYDDDDSKCEPVVLSHPETMGAFEDFLPHEVRRRMIFICTDNFLSDILPSCFSSTKPSRKDVRAYTKKGALVVALRRNDPEQLSQLTIWHWIAMAPMSAELHAKPGVTLSSSFFIGEPDEPAEIGDFGKTFDNFAAESSATESTSPRQSVKKFLEVFGLADFGFNSDDLNELADDIAHDVELDGCPARVLVPLEMVFEAIDKHKERIVDCIDDCVTVCPDRVLETARQFAARGLQHCAAREVFVRDALEIANAQKGRRRYSLSPCLQCGHVNTSFPYKCRQCSQLPKKEEEGLPTTAEEKTTSSGALSADREVEKANALAAEQKSARKRKGKLVQPALVLPQQPQGRLLSSQQQQQTSVASAAVNKPAARHRRPTGAAARDPPVPLPSRSEREAVSLAFSRAVVEREEETSSFFSSPPKTTRRQRKKQPQGDRKLAQKLTAGEIILGA